MKITKRAKSQTQRPGHWEPSKKIGKKNGKYMVGEKQASWSASRLGKILDGGRIQTLDNLGSFEPGKKNLNMIYNITT